jgi:hypothetical protein
MGAVAEASATGAPWWPTGARPRCRMPATRRPSPAGVPRRRGERCPRADAGASAGEGGGESAGGPSRLRPVGQKRGRGLLAPPFPLFHFFFKILFSNPLPKAF